MLYPPPPTTLFQASHYSKAMLLGCSTSCWNVVAALAAVAAAALLLRRRNGRRRLLELQEGFRFRGRDVVVLHMMGRSTTSPNASPFPIKLETYLRAMDIKYEVDFSAPFGPSKSKTPWMTVNGVTVEDSQLCVEYLTGKTGKDMDSHLDPIQRATARAFRVMLEDHLYWVMILERWVYTDCADIARIFPPSFFPSVLPEWARRLSLQVLSPRAKKQVLSQGMGRHGREDALEMARKDLEAISEFLGAKSFLFGDIPCLADASLFAFTICFVSLPGDSRSEVKRLLEREFPNLTGHFHRMRDKYWPDYEECRSK